MSTSPRIGLTRLIIASMMLLAVVAAAAVMPNSAHGTSEAKLTGLGSIPVGHNRTLRVMAPVECAVDGWS